MKVERDHSNRQRVLGKGTGDSNGQEGGGAMWCRERGGQQENKGCDLQEPNGKLWSPK